MKRVKRPKIPTAPVDTMGKIMAAPITFDWQDLFELSILVLWIVLTVGWLCYGYVKRKHFLRFNNPRGLYQIYSMPDTSK